MKKVFAILMVGFTLTGVSYAQQPQNQSIAVKQSRLKGKTIEDRANKQCDTIQSITGCTNDQKAQIYNLVVNRDQKTHDVREANKGGDKATMKAQIQPIRKQFQTDLQAVLTPDQYAKLKAVMKEKWGKKREGKK